MKKACNDVCCVCGAAFSSHFDGKPYCNKHYQSMRKWGQPYGHKRERTNTYLEEGDLLIVTTKKGEKILADIEDAEKLKKYSWCISKTGYAVANINHKVMKLHRYLLGLEDAGVVVDHKNHNKLDNRKYNLRLCTAWENSKNQQGNKGRALPVGIRLTPFGKFSARITHNRKEHFLGNYDTLEEAVCARKKAEDKYCGDFALHKALVE